MKKNSKSKLTGVGFLLKIKKRSKGVDYNPLHFFKKFIQSALIDFKTNQVKFSVNDDNIENILINEIQKKTGFEKKDKKDIKKNISEEKKRIYKYFINLPYRNINKIVFCLRKFKKFNEFVKFNNISYDQLEKLAAYIKHQFVPKGHLLFSMGKKAKRFFCVINGCISLRTIDPIRIQKEKRKKNYEQFEDNPENSSDEEGKFGDNKKGIKIINIFNLENENDDKNKEYEISKYTQGMCLCEWDLIRRRTLIYNAYAIEDTNIFYLEKEYFEKFLSSHISRSDIERKYFITSRIPILSLENLINIQPEFYNKDYIIYTEFDKATEAILIFKGSAAIATLNNPKNKRDIYERKKELNIITNLERGGLAGLEIGKIPIDEEEIFYDNTLIITDDNTIIFRLNIDKIKGKNKNLGRDLKKFFAELYNQQNYFINNLKVQSLKKFKFYNKMTLEEKRLSNLNNFFLSLLTKKIEIKKNNFEKIRTEIKMKHFNTEKNLSKKSIINLKLKRNNKDHKTLSFLEKKQNYKNCEQDSKLFLSTEKKNIKPISLNKINNIKFTKLILRRNINNNSFADEINIKNSTTNYNNNLNNIIFNRENKDIFNNDFINSNIKLKNGEKNKNKNDIILKYRKDINKLYNGISLNYQEKNYYKNENKNSYNTPKYFYDSGNFKIPLISLDIDINELTNE